MPHSSDPVKNAAYMREYRKTAAAQSYYGKYYKSEKGKKRDRASQIKRRYGITIAEYDKRLEEQSHGCAVCGKPPHERYRLSIDHNHDTGQARGLLCQRCNVAIAVLESAALPALQAYLDKWNSTPHVEQSNQGVTSAAAEVSAHRASSSRPGSRRTAPHDIMV